MGPANEKSFELRASWGSVRQAKTTTQNPEVAGSKLIIEINSH
jgi:hypothetical protein